ncbi:class F sortase [Blastococcus capsensis]|uniref:class F sortase n=1 Tax=Blastococcus capsensis TaxID=1564163 RepID=UPI002540759B|nr:class F sortase [Blastococcus capsensis]MDK3257334.1 class F sortase [Blastococcus capsensis]
MRLRRIDPGVVAGVLVFLAAAVAVVLVVGARPGAGPAPQPGAAGAVVPTRLAIPAIGVDAAVESRGTVRYENPFTGQAVDGYGVPESMATTSWWSDGPAPGSGQMAVILGHEQSGGSAVFDRLHELRDGDEVVLRSAAGAVLHLTVLGAPRTGLSKATSALADTLNGHPVGVGVALVTCGGEFDDRAGTSTDNTVVFATVSTAR